MPSKPRRRRVQGFAGEHLSAEQVAEFIGVPIRKGISYFGSEEMKEAAWRSHREQLLATWLEDKDNLGKRPNGWWQFEAPEPRRLLEGSLRPVDERLHLGLPAAFDEIQAPVSAETQAAYLSRLNLLTPEEKAIEDTFPKVERKF